MAQRPPSLTDRRKAAQANSADVVRFRLEGVDYALDRSELSPALERELYQQAGLTPQACLQALSQGATFGLAALVFLARRQGGERVTYLQIESALWEASKAAEAAGEALDLAWIEGDSADGADAGPPLPGASSAG